MHSSISIKRGLGGGGGGVVTASKFNQCRFEM